MELKKMTVEGFIQETSSSSPAPGGGSIAALNAASAAALIEMVAHLTIGKEKKTFTYDFEMKDKDDPNGRLEFNLGHRGSTATVYISNVRVEEIS